MSFPLSVPLNPNITNPALDVKVGQGSGLPILQKFLTNFISIAFVIGSIVFVFMLISGGIQFIIAGSDKDAVQRASKRLTHAVIGLAILFSVYLLIALVGFIFGIDLLQLNFPIIE